MYVMTRPPHLSSGKTPGRTVESLPGVLARGAPLGYLYPFVRSERCARFCLLGLRPVVWS